MVLCLYKTSLKSHSRITNDCAIDKCDKLAARFHEPGWTNETSSTQSLVYPALMILKWRLIAIKILVGDLRNTPCSSPSNKRIQANLFSLLFYSRDTGVKRVVKINGDLREQRQKNDVLRRRRNIVVTFCAERFDCPS